MATSLYIVRLPEELSSSVLTHMFENVSAPRATKAKRYLKVKDQWRSLTGELLLRKQLLYGYGIADMEIRLGTYEKPELINGPDFNISHSGDMVALALSDLPVGVDVEEPRVVSKDLVKSVFTDTERVWVALQSDFQRAFFTLWTLKEAYIKKLGLGLQKSLQEFSIHLSDDIWIEDKKDELAKETHSFHCGEYVNGFWALCCEDSFNGEVCEVAFEELLS